MFRRHRAGWLFKVTVVVAVLLVLAAAPRPGRGAGEPEAADPLAGVRRVYELILERYAGSIQEEQLVQGALRGMVDALGDSHSRYLAPDELERLEEDLQGDFSGIGVVIAEEEGRIVVQAVLPGSPAEAAGVRAQDVILAVEGVSVQGASLEEVARRVRGPEGSRVHLRLQQPGGPPREVTIERRRIEVPLVDSQRLPSGYGYIRISQFNAGAGRQFQEAYEELVAAGVKGLLLDLRGNPGGLLDEGLAVARLLVPRGPVVYIQERGGDLRGIEAKPHEVAVPVAVLVDGGSASAAEIVAGAVKDGAGGLLVGQRTYGKGSVQSVFVLPGLGGIKLTTAHYLTPKRRAIDGKGLQPDVVVNPPPPGAVQAPDLARLADLGERVLRPGMIGLDVLGLQQRLNELHYAAGPEDGIFGSRTRSALQAFQRAHGLPANGVLDEATRQAFARAFAEEIAGTAPGGSGAGSGSGAGGSSAGAGGGGRANLASDPYVRAAIEALQAAGRPAA